MDLRNRKAPFLMLTSPSTPERTSTMEFSSPTLSDNDTVPDAPAPSAAAQRHAQETRDEGFARLLARHMAALDGGEWPDLSESHRRGRELDRIAAGRHQAEISERHRLMLAGLEPVTDDGTWAAHLIWLYREFGTRQFTTAEARIAALGPDGWAAPPGRLPDLDDPKFTRQLGTIYADMAHSKTEDGLWLAFTPGRTHGVRRWWVGSAGEN